MLPHIMGAFIPENNPKARGVFFGIDINHSRAHFTRAILESIGFMLKRDIEIFSKMGFGIKNMTSLGGGAKSDLWNQIKADISGLEIHVPSYTDTALLGAALIAGIGAGVYKDHQEAKRILSGNMAFYKPDIKNKKIYEKSFSKYKNLYKKLESMF
jgi:xylulokinase